MMVSRYAVGVGASSAWGAAFAGGLSWTTAVSEVTTELLGVPLPVVMGAIAGALLARSTADPSVPYGRALLVTLTWILVGSVSAPVTLAMAENFGYKLPTVALAFLALMVSAFGPRLYPIASDRASEFLSNWRKGKDDVPK